MSLHNKECDGCGERVNALFRANEFGVEGLWYCRDCMRHTDTPIDHHVSDVVRILEDCHLNGV